MDRTKKRWPLQHIENTWYFPGRDRLHRQINDGLLRSSERRRLRRNASGNPSDGDEYVIDQVIERPYNNSEISLGFLTPGFYALQMKGEDIYNQKREAFLNFEVLDALPAIRLVKPVDAINGVVTVPAG